MKRLATTLREYQSIRIVAAAEALRLIERA